MAQVYYRQHVVFVEYDEGVMVAEKKIREWGRIFQNQTCAKGASLLHICTLNTIWVEFTLQLTKNEI